MESGFCTLIQNCNAQKYRFLDWLVSRVTHLKSGILDYSTGGLRPLVERILFVKEVDFIR
jgi:hypothetical protein